MSNTQSPELIDDDLSYTQGIRRKIVADLMTAGELPKTDEDRKLLLQVLDGMDRQGIAVKRIKSDEKTGDLDRQANLIIAQIGARVGAGGDPFVVAEPVAREIARPADLKQVEFVKGELEPTPNNLNYDNFTREMEAK